VTLSSILPHPSPSSSLYPSSYIVLKNLDPSPLHPPSAHHPSSSYLVLKHLNGQVGIMRDRLPLERDVVELQDLGMVPQTKVVAVGEVGEGGVGVDFLF
jgi:hypothetical protein